MKQQTCTEVLLRRGNKWNKIMDWGNNTNPCCYKQSQLCCRLIFSICLCSLTLLLYSIL